MNQRINQLDLFLTCMSGNMDILENNLCTLHLQLVDNSRYGFFVTGNRIRGENNRIVGSDGNLSVNARCHTAQRRHVLALASCCNNNGSVVRIILQAVNIHQRILRDVDAAKVHGCINDIYHAAAFNHNFPSIFMRSIDNLLYPVHIGCKGRNDQPGALMLMENRIKGMSYRPLRLCKAFPFRVGGITHQRQHAFFSKLREPLQIDCFTKYRSIVHLKVTGMDNRSRRRMDRQCSRVYDAMVRLDKFDPKLSQIYGLSEFDHLTLRVAQQIVLAQLVFDQSHRQSGRIDRNIQLPQHIRKCSDMILMTVRNHKALYPIRIFL